MKYWILTGVAALVLLFIGIQLLGSRQPIPKANIPAPVKVVSTPLTPENLLKFVNDERAKNGVAPLALDERLNQSAQIKADDMHDNNYFEHVNPNTGKQGYEYAHEAIPECVKFGENIVRADNSDIAIKIWINSKPHHDAMISPSPSLTGFGISGDYVVEHFCEI